MWQLRLNNYAAHTVIRVNNLLSKSNERKPVFSASKCIRPLFYFHPSSFCRHRLVITIVTSITTVSCNAAGYDYCYAYSVDAVNFAGCSSSDICSAGTLMDCKMCNTSYCNTVTPSRISCYTRSGSTGSNGTMTTCHTGVSTCYTYGTDYSNTAGCGRCNSGTDPACITCNTSYCNSWTPSRLSCYYSPSTSSDGSIRSCATAYSTCYSLQGFPYSSGSYYGGCGSCNVTANPSCVTCSSNLCNRRFPSAISCYQRFEYLKPTGSISNGIPVSCSSGITTCYSLTAFPSYLPYSTAGCGTCDPDIVPSCSTCSTSFCNTFAPESVCYHQRSSTDSRLVAPCSRGIGSCFYLKKDIGSLSDNNVEIGISGCGVCTAKTVSLFGCTCDTTNCHVGGAASTGASRTDPEIPRSATTVATRTDPETPWSATTVASRTDPETPRSATTVASRTDPVTPRSPTTIKSRTDPRTAQPAAASTTVSTKQHTTTHPGIKCYYSVAEMQHSARKKVLCSLSSSCYDYSFAYSGATFFFAGCGDCPFNVQANNQQTVVEDSNCRTCKTNFCNSAGSPGQLGFTLLVAALGTATALLKMLHA